MTVNISRGGNSTRSLLKEENGSLQCTWEANDLVLVTDQSGNKLGILELKSGVGEESATFSGDISTTASGNTKLNFLYVGPKSEQDLNDLSNPVEIDYSTQTGTLDWLSENDFFTASQEVSINGSVVNVESLSLSRKVAFGKFELKFPAGVTYGGETITISGTGINTSASVALTDGEGTFNTSGSITITRPENITSSEFYVAVFPGTITPNFSVEVGGKTYSCPLAERTWTASEFVRKNNGDGTYSGIVLTMEEEKSADDTVGPIFEINNRKFRFTKANLAYNIENKEWYLLEEQYSYLHKTGWALANGTWSLPKGYKKNTDIDLFGFGCTGLIYDGVSKTTNAPEYWHQKTLYAGQSINPTAEGYYYPTQETKVNEGYTGSNLVNGISETVFDWGTAYERQASVSGNYFTLNEGDWREIAKNYFMYGATITDIKMADGKTDLYGCLIFNAKDFDGVKSILGDLAPKTTISKLEFKAGDSNNNKFECNTIKLTTSQFKALESTGNIVFLPAAGHRAQESTTKTDGYYWTATAGQAWTSTIFIFDAGKEKYFWLSSSKTRMFGCSVRLVKEIAD